MQMGEKKYSVKIEKDEKVVYIGKKGYNRFLMLLDWIEDTIEGRNNNRKVYGVMQED